MSVRNAQDFLQSIKDSEDVCGQLRSSTDENDYVQRVVDIADTHCQDCPVVAQALRESTQAGGRQRGADLAVGHGGKFESDCQT